MAPRKFWSCHGKDCKGRPCGYQVPLGRCMCDACGHMPPAHVSCPNQRAGEKGGGKVSPNITATARGAGKGVEADAKLKAARDAGKGVEADAKLKAAWEAKAAAESKAKVAAVAEAAALRAEVKKLKAAAPAPQPVVGDKLEGEHDAHDEVAAAAARRTREAEKKVKNLRAIRVEARESIPGFDGILAEAEVELAAARSHKRELRPVTVQKASAESHFKKTQGLLAEAQVQKQEIQKKCDELAEQLKEQDARIAGFEVDVSKAKAELLALANKLTEDLRDAPVSSAPAADLVPGAALWQSVGNLVRFASNDHVRAALATAGMAPAEFNSLEAEIRTVQAAAEGAAGAKAVGHRPAGTTEVVGDMVAEGKRTALQAQLDARDAETQELRMLWADMEQDLVSDVESLAPSEAGEQRDAHRQRKAERAAAKAAKYKKFGEVVSKFGAKGAK